MNTKKKGSRNERRSIEIFEAAGYTCVKAGASLGVFDIVAIGSRDIVLCQSKSNGWPGSVEMEAIQNFVCPSNCRKVVHRWRDRQSLPDVREI